jgi:PilZ domain
VSDPIALARTARESLSKGLSALQGDPSIPAAVAELASPIAQAMGALHQIERSQGTTLQPHADTALAHIRTALGQLQTHPPSHAAITLAMESVASSLAQVHALSKLAAAPKPTAPAAAAPAIAVQTSIKPVFPMHTAPIMNAPKPVAPVQAAPVQAAPVQAAPVQAAPVQAAPKPAVPMHTAHMQPAPKPAAVVSAPPAQANPVPPQPAFPQPSRSAAPGPAPAAVPAPFGQADPFAATAAKSAGGDAGYRAAGASSPLIDAALGAHSVTNFYKGLAGNDIIEHGGLFVGTYMIPKLGSQVRLRVSLPGGYEFEAGAVVRWRRDPGNGDSQPGFGAQLTQISAEAKQLIYRYVRNREPLFHDDL